jgi:hypothetical protein
MSLRFNGLRTKGTALPLQGIDRAYAASDELNAANWFLPHPQIASWTNEFLFELSSFPRGKFDDWVDAWSQAAGELNTGVDYSMFNETVDVFMVCEGRIFAIHGGSDVIVTCVKAIARHRSLTLSCCLALVFV